MPGALTEVGVLRVLLVHPQLVADLLGADQLPPVRLVLDAAQAATTLGVGGDPVPLVLDGQAISLLPQGI